MPPIPDVGLWLSSAASVIAANVRCLVDRRKDSESSERQQWVAISMGRRNTGLKPRCQVFRPEGFAGAPEEPAKQTLPMIDQKAQMVGSRGKPLSEQAIGLSVGKGCQYSHR